MQNIVCCSAHKAQHIKQTVVETCKSVDEKDFQNCEKDDPESSKLP